MTDFEKDILMREVDDEVRRERLQHFWKTFGTYVVGASVLIVLTTVGIVGWQSYKKSHDAKLTSQLLASQQAEIQKKPEEAESLLKAVIAAKDDSLSPFAEIRLRELYLREGKAKEAQELNMSVMRYQGDVDTFGWFAQMLGADVKTLKELDTSSNPFRATSRELLAVNYLKEKNYTEAAALLNAIRSDAETPPTLKERADMLLSTIPANEITKPSAN